ncbi:uncharacterized protein LOC134948437 isoform X2 [Pseudophryne corroboree]
MNGESIGLSEDLDTKSLLSDLVNGSDLPPSVVEKVAASDQLKLEENLESEDLINNNKGASEQVSFADQRLVTSRDATAINDQLSFADNHTQLSFMQSEDMEYKEILNTVHDSAHCSDRKREQDGGELYNGQTKHVLVNHAIKRVAGDIEGTGTISPDEKDNEEISMETTVWTEMHDPSKEDLLSLKQNPEDQKESNQAEFSLYEKPEEKDFLKLKNSKYEAIYLSETFAEHNSELTISNKASVPNVGTPIRSQDLFEDTCNNLFSDICNETIHIANNSDVKNSGKHLQDSKRNVMSGMNETVPGVGHLGLLVNSTTCETEKPIKSRSLDFQSKHADLPKSNGTRTSKRKTEHQLLKGGRSGLQYEIDTDSHELEFVEKENLSEKEESSEEDNIDNSPHYGGSRDRLDHRKERHQYVSDKLDPDVLHLLEMHLRKQQLVDIKEEGEEELLDVHINKEKSRSESFKLLRNIPPVLDMVLEEPELEHAVELLEEGSKTPSDIDSDDSSNICAMEMCLMESLQHDLLSKSSKIDKHEIASILQTASPEMSGENKSKQKAGTLHYKDSNIKCESSKTTEADTYIAQAREPSGPEMITAISTVQGDFGSDFGSEHAALGNALDSGEQTDFILSDSGRGAPDPSVPLGDTVDFVSMGPPGQSCLCVDSVPSDVHEKRLSSVVTHSTHTGTTLHGSKEDAFTGSETTFIESVKTENTSGLSCPTAAGDLKPHDNTEPYLETKIPSLVDGCQKAPIHCRSDNDDFITGNYSTPQHDGIAKALGSEEISLTDLTKDLQAHVKSANEPISAEMSTLHLDLEEKILSILEKAHAADCRSSHLQAEAELLWKESVELRNECKSLSKEAAELLSIFTQQTSVHRHPTRPGAHQAKAGGSIPSDTKPSNKEALGSSSKANPRNKKKGEDQLQLLSKKYNFLRQEAPEIMRDLHVLQRDLKNLPPHHSKPVSVLFNLLWGSLITGGTMLFVWWMNKQLG